MEAKQRQWIIRGVIIIAWIGLGTLLFVLNRGHSLLLDNRDVESPPLRAPNLVTVSLNGGEGLELLRRDRDILDVGGGRQRIRIEFADGTPPFEASFRLPLKSDVYLLSIPRLINGVEPYLDPFDMYGE